jgi:23S rRNA (uracil1939-C5)-methyltransferase
MFILIDILMKNLQGIKIEKIGYGGIGLARMPDGKRILIKGGALPGNIVDLRIVKQKKDYVEAHITDVKSYDPSVMDGEIFCPHFFSSLEQRVLTDKEKTTIGCGWCKWQMMSYPNQLKLKQDIIQDAFTKIKKLVPELSILSIIGSPQEKNYRNKIEFSFWKYVVKKDDQLNFLSDWSLGFHKQGEFSKIVDIHECGLISQKANQMYEYIKNLLRQSTLPVYDQKTHKGFFRHLVIREGVNTDQLLVNLVVSDQFLVDEDKKQSWNDLLLKFQQDEYLTKMVTTFVVTYNNGLADITRSVDSETKIITGEGVIYDKLIFAPINNSESPQENNMVEVSFRISPFSFFQTNTLGAQVLFQAAARMVGYTKGTILDLYCGTWSIGISFLKLGMGDKLVGIEIVEEAIVDAWHNAKISLGDQEVFFAATPAEKAFTNVPEISEKLEDLWLVVVDPPRDGLHKNVISTLGQLKKERDFKLLYISCNPVTMARDLELFLEQGFVLKQIQPVDMFPQTHHIETIWILS